jgi:hypothetical protein
MNQQTTRLHYKSGSSESSYIRSKRGPVQLATQPTIGGWMILVAALAILSAAVVQACPGSPALLLNPAVPLLVVLPSRAHLRLALGRVVKG